MVQAEASWGSIETVRQAMLGGAVSPVELTETALARAADLNPRLHAFIHLDVEGARRAARRAERALRAGGPLGPLHGIPVTVKDLILTRGMPTTAGSRAPGLGLGADRDAPVVRRLRLAGAIVLGKTNLNEFAYGVTGENAHFGDVPTPWDLGRAGGGSSSGSAAALAAGVGFGSLGTDTRGSVRIPAACCGITGHKPTRGLVPSAGVYPLSRTLDHTGPMARSAEDAALLLDVLVDARAARYRQALAHPPRGGRAGIPRFFLEDLDAEVETAFRAAADALARAGFELEEIEVPELAECLPASGAIAAAEALVVHDERMRAGGTGYGPAVRSRLEAAYAVTGLDLARAYEVRRRLIRAYARAFESLDFMLGPTLPGLPATLGGTTMDVGGGRAEGIVNASCRLVAPQNMTGVPAVSVPCGLSSGGLPIGLQIWAASGADERVLSAAHLYQSVTDWHLRRPPLARPGEDRAGSARDGSRSDSAEAPAAGGAP